MAVFFNTPNLSGPALHRAEQHNLKQDAFILLIFLETRKQYTPWEMLDECQKRGKDYLIGSVRRSLTNMTPTDLTKGEQVDGPKGKPVFKWHLNTTQHPLPTAQQATIF